MNFTRSDDSSIVGRLTVLVLGLSAVDDSGKRGGLPTSELFTLILCDPKFAVS